MGNLLVRNCILVASAHESPIAGSDILIRDGLIIAMGAGLEAGEAVVIEANGCIAIPGLVNAHMHSNEAFEQGAYDNLPLEPWLMQSYPPFGFPELSERMHYLRAMLCAIQSIRSGVTTLQDDLLHPPSTPEAVNGAMSAYRDAGLRACVTVSMWNRPMTLGMPFLREILPQEIKDRLAATPLPTDKELLTLFEHLYRVWNGAEDGRLRVILGPCAPQRCSTELLEAISDISRSRNIAMHMHVLETKTQAVTGQELYGKTLVRYLHETGLLTSRLTMNHAIWLTEADIELMGGARCSITHNPLSNLKLGSGICPVKALRHAGVNVALGTDGMTTSDTADQIEALRLASLLHKIESFDPGTWLDAHEAFEMATLGGARSCLLESEIGCLMPGHRADIALLDAGHYGFMPLHDPVRQLCFSVNSEAVRTVIVDGEVVMRDRRMTRIDEVAIGEEIAAAAERFRIDCMPAMRAGAAVMAPYIDEVYRRATATTLRPGFEVLRQPRIGGWQ